jgi:two-component system sensor histidine kinase UhpB
MQRHLYNSLFILGYAIVFWLLYHAATVFWYPSAGLRFAMLLMAPRRLILPALALEQTIFFVLGPASIDEVLWPGILITLAKYSAAASGPLILRRFSDTHLEKPEPMCALLVVMLFTAAATAACNLFYPFASSESIPREQLFLQLAMGDFIGMLVIVPPALMAFHLRPQRRQWVAWRIDIPFILLPIISACAISLSNASEYQPYFFSAGMCLIPAIYMAFRSGWKGAALTLSAASLMIAASGGMNANTQSTLEGQLFMAIAGSAVLILGVATDALRLSQEELHAKNRTLVIANARLDELAAKLRHTAQRNLSLSEDLRRWITAELHDEIGQNLTALQVRIKIIENSTAQPGMFDPVRSLINSMRRTVSGLLYSLRPLGLDEFGLIRSLSEGTIRQLVESAGLQYRVRINEDADLIEKLNNDSQTAIYRIVQEAATNALRHAVATRFIVHLRARQTSSGCAILLVCADNGTGISSSCKKGGMGLSGISDRVISFGGQLRIRTGETGTRLSVAIVFPLAATHT